MVQPELFREPTYCVHTFHQIVTFAEPFSVHSFLFQNEYNKLQNDERKPIMLATKSFEPPHHQAGGLG